MDEFLDTALEAAHRAGEVLLQRMGRQHHITTKGFRDIVTDADTAAEAAILSLIHDRFPDHAILSEEAGAQPADSPHTWVIDPLDGTTNYSRGHPTFAVSIAVTRRGDPLIGVVYDPLRGHTFAARRGEGATLNGLPIRASTVEQLDAAMIALDWAHSDADRQATIARLSSLAARCRTVRSLGSAALALAYVGVGWLDAYFGAGLYPWDTAAGGLIVTEAGGEIVGLDTTTWQTERAAVLATNGRLHREVIDVWGTCR